MNVKSKNSLVVIIILWCSFIFSGCSTYNNLVTLDEGVKEAWAQVETQLQRRYAV
jgi:hypothetical protein